MKTANLSLMIKAIETAEFSEGLKSNGRLRETAHKLADIAAARAGIVAGSHSLLPAYYYLMGQAFLQRTSKK